MKNSDNWILLISNKIQFLLDPEIKINRQQTNDLEFDIKTCVNLVSFINSIQA